VIPEDGHNRQSDTAQFAGKNLRLFRETVVGEVARNQQDIGRVADGRKERLEGALRVLCAVQVAHGCHAHKSHIKKLFKIRANDS
jgi:hypothetical protein